eukprot:5221749-Alexandrium_andersonii.AAC.1
MAARKSRGWCARLAALHARARSAKRGAASDSSWPTRPRTAAGARARRCCPHAWPFRRRGPTDSTPAPSEQPSPESWL